MFQLNEFSTTIWCISNADANKGTCRYAVCPRSLDPFYIVGYHIKCVRRTLFLYDDDGGGGGAKDSSLDPFSTFDKACTVSPRSNDPFYIVTYCIKWVSTSWTHSKFPLFNSFVYGRIFRPISYWEGQITPPPPTPSSILKMVFTSINTNLFLPTFSWGY